MARTKNFDREETLILAMELFWQKGFSQTSLADLVEHLGINRFSLYSTYGDKRSLYHESLQYYIDNYSLPALERLRSPNCKIDDLIDYIAYFGELQYTQTSGCFVQNALLELSLCDDEVGEKADSLYMNMLDAIKRVIEQENHRGIFASSVDAVQLSRFLLVQMQGIRVMGKAKQYDVMSASIEITCDYLRNLKRLHTA